MEVSAKLVRAGISAQKARLVADQIRGLSAESAVELLQFSSKKAAKLVKKVVDSVRAAGGEVISVCVMVNRDPKNVNEASVGAPFVAADVLEAQAFDEAVCPFCKQNRPINTKIGHGKAYLEAKANK